MMELDGFSRWNRERQISPNWANVGFHHLYSSCTEDAGETPTAWASAFPGPSPDGYTKLHRTKSVPSYSAIGVAWRCPLRNVGWPIPFPFVVNTPAETQYKVLIDWCTLSITCCSSIILVNLAGNQLVNHTTNPNLCQPISGTNLIVHLCTSSNQRSGRDGIQELKAHPFFNGSTLYIRRWVDPNFQIFRAGQRGENLVNCFHIFWKDDFVCNAQFIIASYSF